MSTFAYKLFVAGITIAFSLALGVQKAQIEELEMSLSESIQTEGAQREMIAAQKLLHKNMAEAVNRHEEISALKDARIRALDGQVTALWRVTEAFSETIGLMRQIVDAQAQQIEELQCQRSFMERSLSEMETVLARKDQTIKTLQGSVLLSEGIGNLCLRAYDDVSAELATCLAQQSPQEDTPAPPPHPKPRRRILFP